MEKVYKVSVYNTLTGKYESVDVSEEIYRIYGDGKTANHEDDRKFYSHEIQFSGLVGGEEDSYENFQEFQTTESDPQEIAYVNWRKKAVAEAVNRLPSKQREDITLAFYEKNRPGKVAKKLGISRQAEHKRRLAAYAKLKKFLKKYEL